jgi:xanthine dehydrogenase/oxidase
VVPARAFFLGYRKVDLKPHEVIKAITLPLPQTAFEFVQPYKQARRREDDISIATGCVRMRLAPAAEGVWVIEEAGLGFGGMAPTTVAAPKTEAFLQGKVWSQETIEAASKLLREDLPLPASVPGGQAEYRRTLPPSFLLKFFVKTSLDLAALAAADKVRVARCARVRMWMWMWMWIDGWLTDQPPLALPSVAMPVKPHPRPCMPPPPHTPPQSLPPAPTIPESERSAARSFLTEPKPSSRGEQRFTAVRTGDGLQDARPEPHAAAKPEEAAAGRGAVGKPIMHKSALAQVSRDGSAIGDVMVVHGRERKWAHRGACIYSSPLIHINTTITTETQPGDGRGALHGRHPPAPRHAPRRPRDEHPPLRTPPQVRPSTLKLFCLVN